MRIGVSTATLFNRLPNEEAVVFLREHKIKTAEIFLTSFSEYDDCFARLLRERKGQLDVNSVHVLNSQFEPQLFSDNERVKKDAFFWLDKAMSAAEILQAKYYTFHGLARFKKASREKEWDKPQVWGKRMEEIEEVCKNHNVRLSLENVEWSTYSRVGLFTKILETFPTLLGVLDLKQARISGYPYEAYLEEMSGKISHVHISDLDEKGNIRLPGQGIFNFSELLKRLNGANFNGALEIETYSGNYYTLEEIIRSAEYMQELMYKHGYGE